MMTLTNIISTPYTTYLKTVDAKWYSCNIVRYGISGTSIIVKQEPQKFDIQGISKIVSDKTKTFYILENGTVYVSGHDTYNDIGIAQGESDYYLKKHPLENVKDIYLMIGSSDHWLNTSYTIFRTNDDEYLAAGVFDGHTYTAPQRFNLEEYLDKTKIMFPVLLDDGLYKVYNAPDGLPKNIKQVASNNDFTYFLTTSGLVYATGKSYASNFGLSLSQNKIISIDLIQLPILDVKSVKIGTNHALFLNNNGELYGCGSNQFGQLGFGKGIPTIPNISLIDSEVQFIEAGIYCSFYAKMNGDIKFMGNNEYNKFGDTNVKDIQFIYEPIIHSSLKFSTKVYDFTLPEKKKIDYTYKGIYHRIIIQYEKVDDDTIKMSSYIHTPSLGTLNQIHEDYLFKLTTDSLQESYDNIELVSNQRIEDIKNYITKFTNYYETPHYSTNTIIKLTNGSIIEVSGEKTKEECIEIVKNYVYKKYNTIYDGNKYYSKNYADNLVVGDATWRPKGSKIYTLSELNKDKYNYY